MSEPQTLRVLLAQHKSETHRPDAWHICVETGYDGKHFLATCFYMRGSLVQGYQLHVVENVRYRTISSFRGAMNVGRIKLEELGAFAHYVTTAVQYPRDDRVPYEPQDWAVAALRRLNARGLLRTLWTRECIEPALHVAREDWEAGDQ
ncbi:hypothetical protein GY45DRAFT_1243986 [Cubamyces sp. BRFM 1775]|nr:hypothetical protein GY45DRAFT_1243986 [Cubamyces sp. BRFM 1775]